MRKLIALCLMAAVSVWTLGPALTVAQVDVITTSLNRSTGGGANPIVKTKWEMNGPYQEFLGTDDSVAEGAQFAPPGVWGATKNVAFCAIVTDPDGVSDIDGVYADWYYPADRAFHPMDPANPDHTNGGTLGDPDYGISGCGSQYEDENQLFQLTKADGYNLFCNTIRTKNTNLPTFYSPYTYDEICGETGELMKEEAYVYCANKTLTWEDPAGDYKVEILALDKAGLFSYEGMPNSNYFEYLPMTGYQTDFNSVSYGDVKLNTHKIISGDKTWDTALKPSVRNVGNTRLYMWVEQDDMGLGTTDGIWNVQYDARVGNSDADWKVYSPETSTQLEDILDLSEIEEMDFSIEVFKFPSTQEVWSGEMMLSATGADFRQCAND